MTQMIKPERLRLVRKIRGLSRVALAGKAGLTAKTVYRLEKGDEAKPIRQANLERLAKPLDVDYGVLTGEEPMPLVAGQQDTVEEETAYQLNVRVDGQIRNAFSLASLHYKVPVRRIVELAPLLFVLAAEGSLKRRREKIAELEAALERASDHWCQIPHFPSYAAESNDHREVIDAEKKSIAARDLYAEYEFGHALTDRDDLYEGYDSEKDNPFALYISELADTCDETVIESLGIYSDANDYSVCWSEAVDFAGGDQRLAVALHLGMVPIHEILRELKLPDHLRGMQLTPAGAQRRVEWIRRAVEPHSDLLDRILENPPGWMQDKGVAPVLPNSVLLDLTEGDEALAQRLADALRSGNRISRNLDLLRNPALGNRVETIRWFLEKNATPDDPHARSTQEPKP